MKKLFISLILFLTISNFSFSQNVKIRELRRFDKIVVIGNIDVELVKSDKESAVLELENIDADQVKTDVKQRTLKIRLKSLFYKNYKVKIKVNYKELRKITASASAKISSDTPIEIDKLELKANSAGKINLIVDVNVLNATASQGSVITLKGDAEYQKSIANSGGELLFEDLDTENADVSAHTGGKANVYVRNEINILSTTGGLVHYTGSPKKETFSTELGGKITKD